MSRWFRHYAGLCRDAKLISIAIKSKQTIERVVWVYSAILESASEIDDGGRYQIDHAEIAYFLRADESDISAVEDALCSVQRVSDGIVVKWADRQFQSDRSAERTRRYRDRNAGSGDNDKHAKRETSQSSDVTSQTRHCDAPETETETDSVVVVSREGKRDQSQIKAIEAECRKAAGLEQAVSASLFDMSPILGLMDAGADLTETILPAIAARPNPRASSWRYFVPQIQTAMQNRASAAVIQPQRPPDKPFGTASPPKRSGRATWMDAIIQGGRNEPDQRSSPIIDVTPNPDHASAFG